jgi:hypothetical protein
MTIAHIPPTYIKASVSVYTGHWITKKVDIHTYMPPAKFETVIPVLGRSQTCAYTARPL